MSDNIDIESMQAGNVHVGGKGNQHRRIGDLQQLRGSVSRPG